MKDKNKQRIDYKLFYLGFLASVGLALGSSIIIFMLGVIVQSFINIDLSIHSRIVFSIFYLFFLAYTYWLLQMNKKENLSLKKGFILFIIIFILSLIYLWSF